MIRKPKDRTADAIAEASRRHRIPLTAAQVWILAGTAADALAVPARSPKSEPRPMGQALDEPTAEILRRCYRYESPADVLARALRLLATADGHLDPAGRIITGPRTGRRT
ncbi:hypothetical protein ACIQVR_41055 [Streptomyces xanthochromogenes]|uniref:hypothetical protein n=1 Tax=Streptomyces xanthochromogenes TaxID=67384 RepID=UPI00381EDCE6